MARRAGPSRCAGRVPRVRDSGLRGRPVHVRRRGRGQRADRGPDVRPGRDATGEARRLRHDPVHADLGEGPDDARPERPDPARERDRRRPAQRDPRRPLALSVRLERDAADRPGSRGLRRVLRRRRGQLPARPRLHHRQRAEPEPLLAAAVRPERRGRRGARVRAAARVTYDALKAVRPHSTIYGGALAPRGVDKPGTGRDTHSPTAFITDLGAAYRASGRQLPIMDAFAFHPYPESSSTGPNFPHPNSTSIGLADYPKLVALLGTAFDGTAQHGSSLPILYDEFGIETTVPGGEGARSTPAPSRRRRGRSTTRRRRRCTPRRCRWSSARRP